MSLSSKGWKRRLSLEACTVFLKRSEDINHGVRTATLHLACPCPRSWRGTTGVGARGPFRSLTSTGELNAGFLAVLSITSSSPLQQWPTLAP